MSTSENFGFKEWALVCEALGLGHQSLLLRKGGIAEGKKGFGFEHDEFLLFPTWFHGQVEKTRLNYPSAVSLEAPEVLRIEYRASIEWSGFITDREKLNRLMGLHILDDSVIDERFEYDPGNGKEGLHVAFVRIYCLDFPLLLPMQKCFRGCRSWVKIPEVGERSFVSVLSDEEHEARRKELKQALA